MSIPWSERVNALSINPDAAQRKEVAKLAADLTTAYQLLAMWWAHDCPTVNQRLKLSTTDFLSKMTDFF